MKCITTLGDLSSSPEFVYLENYGVRGDCRCLSFSSRYAAYRMIKRTRFSVSECYHVCFNPATNDYTLVAHSDYKDFKRCASFVKNHYKYFERIGIL